MDYNAILEDIIAYRVWMVYREDYQGDMAQVKRGKVHLETYAAPRERCDITLAGAALERMKRDNPGWLTCCRAFAGHKATTEQVFVYLLLRRDGVMTEEQIAAASLEYAAANGVPVA